MDILDILIGLKDDADFENSEDFIEDGLLDSFDLVNLVAELETEFDIEIKGSDIIPENFVSIEKIAELVEKYQQFGAYYERLHTF